MLNRYKDTKGAALNAPRLAGILFIIGCLSIVTPTLLKAGENTSESNQRIAATVVHSTATGLGAILKDIKEEQERITLIRTFIDGIRFYSDQSGYFFVYDFDCMNIAHATQKELPGKKLCDHRDARGKFVIRELSAAAQKGGGFVEYYWVKPGLEGEHRKMGYVEPIPNTRYFIGTGVYLLEK